MRLFRRPPRRQLKNTQLRRSNRRRLVSESLEARQLLAGDFVINELRISSPGSLDNASNNFVEFYETSGTASDPFTDLSLVVLNGNSGTTFSAGGVAFVFDLSTGSTDSQGFMLLHDDGSSPSINKDPGDIEAADTDFFGSPSTFLLVSNYTGSGTSADDYDTDNDGILDSPPWTAILDSVSLNNVAGDGLNYSTNVVSSSNNFTPAAVARIPDGTGAFALQRAPNDPNNDPFGDDTGDTPGFTNDPSFVVTESDGATGVVEGTGSDSFTIELTTAPSDDVVVDLTFGGQINASPAQLTFTSASFGAQTVTVTGINDGIPEGLHSDTVSFTVSSADAAFDGAFIADVQVTISDPPVLSTNVKINEVRISHSTLDNDSNNFIELYDTNGTASLDLTGLTVIVLTDNFNGTPSGVISNVIPLDGGSTDADGFTLLYDDGSDVGIVKDSGDLSIANLDFSGVPSTFLLVTGFTGAQGQDLDTNDDGALDVTPWVTRFDGVTLDSLSGTAGYGLGYPVVNSPDTFAAAGGRRIVDGSGTYSLLRFNDDGQDTPGFTNILAPGVRIIDPSLDIADGMTADLELAEARTIDFSSNVEAVMDTFSIVLDAAPAGNVTITVDPDTQLQLFSNPAGSPTNLTFTPGNWYLPQMVTVTAVDDLVNEGDHTGAITVTPSGDATYAALSPIGLTANIIDNDSPNSAVVINEVLYDPGTVIDANLDLVFSSTEDEFVELLNTGASPIDLSGWTLSGDQGVVHQFPSGTVLAAGQAYVVFAGGTIGAFGTYADSFDGIAQAAAASSGTLGLANGGETVTLFDGVQTIDQLTYVDGAVNDESLARGPNGDGPFAGSASLPVNLNLELATPGRDNEGDFASEFINGKAILTIQTGSGLAVNEEGETSDTFDVVLAAQPSAPVTVSVVSDSQTTVSTSSLIFSTSNWYIPQTVTVTAVDDGDVEGSHSSAISLAASGADAAYNALTNPDVIVNVIDNDGAAVAVVLNEIFVNPGGTDDGREYVEILSTTGGAEALTGLWLLEIEGNGTVAGTIDNAQDLSSLSTGSNGLLMLGSGYGTSGTPWPAGVVDAATALGDLDGGTIENGGLTFLLVTGFSGSAGDDVDTDNDGVIDNPLWSTVVDSVGWTDNGSGLVYSPAALTQVAGTPDAATRFLGNTTADSAAAWYNGDIDNTDGDFSQNYVSGDNSSANLPAGGRITPGSSNTLGVVDATPPVVTNVRISGSSWLAPFLGEVDPADSIGFALPGAQQLATLPWFNLDTITVDFSEPVVFSSSDVQVFGVNSPSYSVAVGAGASASQIVITLTSGDFDTDKVLLQISDTLTDTAGNPLDGDWIDGVSLVSGNGGDGDFNFRFNILEGDANRSSSIFGDDVTLVNTSQFQFAGITPGFNPFNDVNASGSIFGDDVTLVNGNQFTFLPPGEPAPPLLALTSPIGSIPASLASYQTEVDELFAALENSDSELF